MASLAVIASALVAVRPSARVALPVSPVVHDREALEAQRSALLQQLAQLDETYQGRSSNRHYRTQRVRLFDQALALYRLLGTQDEPR
jgi:hypothetical protein